MCTVQLHTFKITADEYIRMFIFSDTDILILKCLQLLPPLESCTGTFYCSLVVPAEDLTSCSSRESQDRKVDILRITGHIALASGGRILEKGLL
jgi:hypothetical protein